MRVGFLQLNPTLDEVDENVWRAVGFLRGVRDATIVLPELFNSGYLFLDREALQAVAETVPGGKTTKRLQALAQKNRLHIVFGLPERAGSRIYNSSVLVTPRGEAHVYRKVHLFDRETEVFTPGNTSWKAVRTPEAKLGMMICFDWRFPEACRVLALEGVQIVCHPSNLVHSFCQDAMRTRCVENRVFAITANRIGRDRRGSVSIGFTGRSQIVDPEGKVLVRAERANEVLKVIEIDPKLAEDKRITPRNHLLESRRPRFYRRLVS